MSEATLGRLVASLPHTLRALIYPLSPRSPSITWTSTSPFPGHPPTPPISPWNDPPPFPPRQPGSPTPPPSPTTAPTNRSPSPPPTPPNSSASAVHELATSEISFFHF